MLENLVGWLTTQAQGAGGFIAVFCLAVMAVLGKVCVALWKQLIFERAEHRTAEKDFTEAAVKMAGAMEKLAARRNGR